LRHPFFFVNVRPPKESPLTIRPALDWWSCRRAWKAGVDAVPRIVRRAVELGAEGLLLDYIALPPPLRDNPARLLSLQSEFRLEYALGGGAPLALPKALWGAARTRRQAMLDYAQALSAKVVRVPLSLLSPVSWTPATSLAVGSWYLARALAPRLGRLCEKAAARGLTVAIENQGAFKTQTLLRLFELTDASNLRFSLAVGRFVAQGEDPYRATELLAPHAALVVLEDVTGAGLTARATPLGDGRIDLAEILRLLDRAGFAGLCAVRVDPPRRAADQEDEWVKRSFVHLAQLCDRLDKEEAT
jgi:sugar phosphate isomerase/epimerase